MKIKWIINDSIYDNIPYVVTCIYLDGHNQQLFLVEWMDNCGMKELKWNKLAFRQHSKACCLFR